MKSFHPHFKHSPQIPRERGGGGILSTLICWNLHQLLRPSFWPDSYEGYVYPRLIRCRRVHCRRAKSNPPAGRPRTYQVYRIDYRYPVKEEPFFYFAARILVLQWISSSWNTFLFFKSNNSLQRKGLAWMTVDVTPLRVSVPGKPATANPNP